VAKKIPYGTYTLRVSAPGFRGVQRDFRLDQTEVSVRTQLSVSVECGGFAKIGGSVEPAPKDRELWIKLVPLRGVGGSEVRVSRDGSFLTSGLDDGQYLLLVLDGKTVLHSESFDVTGSKRVVVGLAKN